MSDDYRGVRAIDRPLTPVVTHVLGTKEDDQLRAGPLRILIDDLVRQLLSTTILSDAIEGAAAGEVRATTWAGLSAIAGTRAGQPGEVTGPDTGTHTDPVAGGTAQNVGEYIWSLSPAGWQRVQDATYPFVTATPTGASTANAIVATTTPHLGSSPDGTLIRLFVAATNTGPVTVKYDDDGPTLPVVSSSGAALGKGALVAGTSVLGSIRTGRFWLDTSLPIGVRFINAAGKLLLATDASGRYTDIDIRSSDGKFDDRVINGMAPRLGGIIGPDIPEIATLQATDQSILTALANIVQLIGPVGTLLTVKAVAGKLLLLTDASGRYTDLDIRSTDGKIDQRVMLDWARRIGPLLGYNIKSVPGKLLLFTDLAGRYTDIDIRRSDGKIDDRVIADWARRLGPLIGQYIPAIAPAPDPTFNVAVTLPASTYDGVSASRMYVRGKEVLPVNAYNGEISAWGASNIRHWYLQLADIGNHYGVSTYQGGCDSETPAQMAARMGQTPMPVKITGGVIPAYDSTGATPDVAWTPSNTTIYNDGLRFQNAEPYHSTEGFYGRNFTGWLATPTGNVYGYLWIDTSTPRNWRFHRLPVSQSSIPTYTLADNVSVTVADFVPFLPEDGPKHRNDISIIAPGNNGINANLGVDDTINTIDNCFDWLASQGKRALVHQLYCWPSMSGKLSQINAVNEHIRWRYGKAGLSIDLNDKVLSNDIWSDPRITAAGITPTSADTANQAAGICPASLLLSDGVHFLDATTAHPNSGTNWALRDWTVAKIDALGWVPSNPSPVNH